MLWNDQTNYIVDYGVRKNRIYYLAVLKACCQMLESFGSIAVISRKNQEFEGSYCRYTSALKILTTRSSYGCLPRYVDVPGEIGMFLDENNFNLFVV